MNIQLPELIPWFIYTYKIRMRSQRIARYMITRCTRIKEYQNRERENHICPVATTLVYPFLKLV